MINIYFDFEFLDDGRTIEPISLGMVAEDGEELYLINAEAPLDRIAAHSWLPGNVVPYLPLKWAKWRAGPGSALLWDTEHEDTQFVVPRIQMRIAVAEFVLTRPDPQLWAWFAAYDHVALCQLFGPMVDLPAGFPQRTNDLAQLAAMSNTRAFPEFNDAQHHALSDARWNMSLHRWLMSSEAARV